MKLAVLPQGRTCAGIVFFPGRFPPLLALGVVAVAVLGLAPQTRGQNVYPTPYTFTTLAGGTKGTANGAGAAAQFDTPAGVAVDTAGNVYVADSGNNAVRKVTPGGLVTTLAGTPGGASIFFFPNGVAVDAAGNVFLADTETFRIYRISPAGAVATLAGNPLPGFGNGTGAAAQFNRPLGIAIDAAGTLFVADTENNAIRRVTAAGVVTILAGGNRPFGGSADGVGTAAQFNKPSAVAVDGSGNVYVADRLNHTIRRVTPAGVVTTLAGLAGSVGSADGAGSAARFQQPTGIAVDGAGNVYVADTDNGLIRRITPAGVVTTLGGRFSFEDDGVPRNQNGTGVNARFHFPRGIAIDAGGTLYVGDSFNHSIRVGMPPPLPPSIVSQPISQTVAAGAAATFTVAATGSGSLAYQWRKAGVAISGATGARLVLANVQVGDAAVYSVIVTNSVGSVTSGGATLNLASANPGRLINLSIRTNAGTGAQTLIVGFVVGGAGTSGTKPLLIRGVGPALGGFGVPGFLADPTLSVFAGATVAASNDNWAGDAAVTTIGGQVGAFALGAATSRDAALYSPALAARDYTAQITGVGGTTGIVLAEIYDATPVVSYTAATPRLANVSARTQVGTGADILIAGFVIGGDTPKTLLIRAIGPTLTGFGVTGALADPRLDVFTGGGTFVQTNDNWTGDAAIVSLATSVGAFPLAAGTRDSVLLLTLAPGSYTAQVAGVANGTGVALVEIYDVP